MKSKQTFHQYLKLSINPLSVNPEKWSNTLKQIVGNLPTICLSVFDHFMNLALKGLKVMQSQQLIYHSNYLERGFIPLICSNSLLNTVQL